MQDICNLINSAAETVWFFRQQYFFRGQGQLKKLILDLQQILQEIVDVAGTEFLNQMGIAELLDAQEKGDEILIADVIEGQLLPSLECLIQNLQQDQPIEHIDYLSSNLQVLRDKGENQLAKMIEKASARQGTSYAPEYTASGQVTVRLVEDGKDYYVSGNNNPYRDALYFVQGNMEPDKYQYVIIGTGLFFEVEALLKQRPDVEIVVVEEDAYLLKMALKYRELSAILSDDRITIECCEYVRYIEKTDVDNQGILIRKPAMKHMENLDCRMILKRFFVKAMTIKEQAYVLEKEFRQNIKLAEKIKSIDECKEKFVGRTVYLVAGGPSLNGTIEMLKRREKDSVILCVGTSASVLKKEEIAPDFVIITDVAEGIFHQINNNVDPEKTALLYMISANAKAVASFSGQKYAIFQKGFDLAEDYAGKHNYMLVSTGGSVSTTALDICIRFGCKKVICLGLDLAYTDNKTHAAGTHRCSDISKELDMPMVKNVDGKMIPTSLNLSCYQKWIENRISDEEKVEFVNISNGAYIDGMRNLKPIDVI